MRANNRDNVIWLKKMHSHPERKAVSQKTSEKYRNHCIVPRTNAPRRSRRGA